eukprot:scaffold1187_cov374-Prasinococcus_capsulatus_cf.AAC.12
MPKGNLSDRLELRRGAASSNEEDHCQAVKRRRVGPTRCLKRWLMPITCLPVQPCVQPGAPSRFMSRFLSAPQGSLRDRRLHGATSEAHALRWRREQNKSLTKVGSFGVQAASGYAHAPWEPSPAGDRAHSWEHDRKPTRAWVA